MATALVLAGAASMAAPATFNGPSIARPAETASFKGKGFRANTAVTVVVTDPSGAESHYSAVTDAGGRLRHDLAPSASGLYRLKVIGAQGRELASTVVNVPN